MSGFLALAPSIASGTTPKKQGRNKIPQSGLFASASECIPERPNTAAVDQTDDRSSLPGSDADCQQQPCRSLTPVGLRHAPLVLVLGMPKCGTTSLNKAFISAGLRSVHWALGAGIDARADKQLRERGLDADRRLISKLMRSAAMQDLPPLAHLPEDVNAVAEMNGLFWVNRQARQAEGYFPQMSLLEDLLSYYPAAHFILNIRDHKQWVKSVDKHNDLRDRFVCADLPGLPSGAGAQDDELIGWVEAHHQRVQKLLGARNSRLLVFDLDRHGEPELSAFLGRKVVWGHHNWTR